MNNCWEGPPTEEQVNATLTELERDYATEFRRKRIEALQTRRAERAWAIFFISFIVAEMALLFRLGVWIMRAIWR